MLRLIVLSSLWIIGLTPTTVSLLMVVAMAGRPALCDRPDCQNRTYGDELLILPAATGLPFLMGWKIASMGRKKPNWRPPIGGKHYAS